LGSAIEPSLKPIKPVTPCFNCGENDWWYRESPYKPDEWLCKRCKKQPPKIKLGKTKRSVVKK